MGISVPVKATGLDGDAAGAPPLGEPYMAAWFKGSPRPGDGRGNVVVTAHTYSKGQAVGNDLYGAHILKKRGEGTRKGDIWALTNGDQTVCYEVTSVQKVAVKDYDPNSNLIYENAGPEEMVMVICWDKNWSSGKWDSRVVFTARRV